VDGGGSARHSGQVPNDACPHSHRTGSVTGPHSTPAMRHSTVKGEHEKRRGREPRLQNAFPRSVYLQHRFQHRRVLQPPSEEKDGSARPVTTTTAATATPRTQPDGAQAQTQIGRNTHGMQSHWGPPEVHKGPWQYAATPTCSCRKKRPDDAADPENRRGPANGYRVQPEEVETGGQ
jgi:hypothetical protein